MCLLVSLATASSAAAQTQEEPRLKVWVYSEVTNFFHESIPAGKTAIEQLGEEHDFDVVVSDDSSMFNDATLAEFDAVVFNNTNSTPAAGALMTADERAAFQRYINGGGGFVGIHSASGTERDWEWYQQLVGASFRSHPAIQDVEVEVSDRVHPSTKDLPKSWTRNEEPYDFQTNPRGSVHVLATFDESTYSGALMGPDHPISWCHRFEGGRSWYTGMGHNPSAFGEELFLEHVLGGIEWAAGAAEGDCGATVYENFEKVGLVEGSQLVDPMELAVAPDGRVFFIERAGAVKVYDPETERVTVRGTELTVAMRITIVHELVHALQDQHFDLSRAGTFDTDAQNSAFDAVVEGDAVSIENIYYWSLSEVEQAAYDAELDAQVEDMAEGTAGVPGWLAASMQAPYALGEPFVTALVAARGPEAVDDALRHPPASEEQLMDVARFLAGDEPQPVRAPRLQADDRVIDKTDFGTLSWLFLLAERIPAAEALGAADG
jgi:type 1 glutamine amidotransferase